MIVTRTTSDGARLMISPTGCSRRLLHQAGRSVTRGGSTVLRACCDAAGARHAPPEDVPAQLLEELVDDPDWDAPAAG